MLSATSRPLQGNFSECPEKIWECARNLLANMATFSMIMFVPGSSGMNSAQPSFITQK